MIYAGRSPIRWSLFARLMAVFSMVVAGLVLSQSPATAASAPIVSAGPLTRVEISDQLNCAVSHVDDEEPEWYGDTACGTFLAVGGVLYGPGSVPAGSSAGPRTAWTSVSQTPVTGAGTQANPFRVTTVTSAGTSGVQVTQTDSYVTGEESYTTDIAVSNTSGAAVSGVVYRAGDCYLQSSDAGFGAVDPVSGAVACTTEQASTARIEQLYPITAGSRYMEGGYDSVWAAVGSQQQLPNTCACASEIDNGIGLSWPVSLPAGGAKTYTSLTTFSPLGRTPLTITATADATSVPAGSTDGYSLTVTNNNPVPVTLGSVTSTLAAGFSYTADSTSGAITTNPTISGQDLTWGPLTVPSGSTAVFHYGVTVASTPGTYTLTSDGVASGYTIIGSGSTASITVTGTNHAPVAANQSVTTPQNTAKAITLGATDPDGNTLTYAIVTGPSHGTLTGTGANRTYTPTTGYTGPDSFTFKANDGLLDSNTATVTLTVTPVNHAPVAANQSVTTPQNTAKAITLGATDPDGNTLTYAIVTGPSHGTLTGTGANRTYTPTTGYTGPDSFTFKANDGLLDSNTATVTLTVTPVATPPVEKHKIHGAGSMRSTHHGAPDFFFVFKVRQTGDDLSGKAKVTGPDGVFRGNVVTSCTVDDEGEVADFVIKGTYGGRTGYTLTVTAIDRAVNKVELTITKGGTTYAHVSGKVKQGTIKIR